MTATLPTQRTYRTLNPATGELLREYPFLEDAELGAKLAKAHEAFLTWRDVPIAEKVALFTKVADQFYNLVVKSDVGSLDVAWGLKDQRTSSVTKLTNQKNLELKALDEDFRKVLEDDK